MATKPTGNPLMPIGPSERGGGTRWGRAMVVRPAVLYLAAGMLLAAACSSDEPMPTSTAPSPTMSAAPHTEPPTPTVPATGARPTTTSTLPATTITAPPSLVVTDPASGAVVDTKTYQFRGTTDPGCTVLAAGQYATEVDSTGAWSIVLTLNPGSNVASFIATNPAGITTEVRVPVAYQPKPDNLGLAAKWIDPLADGAAVGIHESAQGSDLNGDGDTEDVLVYVVGAGGIVNTGLQSYWGVAALSDGGFAVAVYEGEINRDLNNDGDTRDAVVHTWTRAAGATNSGLAGRPTPGPDGSIWVEVRELSQGSDLNGDGDLDDDVAHRWRPGNEVVNTGWAAGELHPRTDGTVLMGVFESRQGEDLNGDGKIGGRVAMWWRSPGDAVVVSPEAAAIIPTTDGAAIIFREAEDDVNRDGFVSSWNLRFWHPERPVIDNRLPTVCHRATGDGGLFFKVSEQEDFWAYSGSSCETGTDRNGDGDCNDFILHRWSPTGGFFDSGLTDTGWCPECDCGFVAIGSDALVAVAPDPHDGSSRYRQPRVLHAVRGIRVEHLGIPVAPHLDSAGVIDGAAIIRVVETSADLNGDGDVDDIVLHHVALDGETTNLGLAGPSAVPVAGGALLLANEAENGTDLNRDGFITEETPVAHLWRPGSQPRNIGVTAAMFEDEGMERFRPHSIVAIPGTNQVVMLVPEDHHGRVDLNGDGDTDDLVVFLVPLPHG